MGRSFFSFHKRKKTPAKSPESSVTGGSSQSYHAFRIQDTDDLRQVFDKYDTNGDGKISSAELRSMLQCLGHSGSSEEVESMMMAADLDGDGFISLDEFISVNTMETDSSKCIEDLRNAFTLYDRDRNGLISAEELQHVLRSIGEKVSLSECKTMIRGIDQNGDGAVNFEEFVQMMTKSLA